MTVVGARMTLDYQKLLAENEALRLRLEEAEETLAAIRGGEVDALLVASDSGEKVFTLAGADQPYRVMVETMSEGAATLHSDSTVLFANTCLARLLGLSLDKVLGKPLLAHVAPADATVFATVLERALATSCRLGESFRAEITFRTERGAVPALLSCCSLDIDGNPGISVIVTDLSEQKRNEEIVAAGELASSILDQAGEAIIVCDDSGRVVRASRQAHELFGKNPLFRPFNGLGLLQVSGLGEPFSISAPLSGKVMQGVEVTMSRSGRQLHLLLSATPLIKEKKLLGCVVTLTDYTARRQAEEAVQYSKDRLAAALGIAELGVWEYDAAAAVTQFDQRSRDIFGLPDDRPLPNDEVLALVHPDDRPRVQGEVLRALDPHGTGLYETEYRVVRRDGMPRWVAVRGHAIRSDGATGGRIVQFVGTVMDISGRKRAEEALRESEAKYRSLFENIDAGFCLIEMIFDRTGRAVDYRFLETNPAFEKQTGLVNAQGRTMRELAPQHEEHWFESYGRIALTGQPARFENWAEQFHRWFEVFAFRHGPPENRQVAVLFTDTTERKRTEAALQANSRRFKLLADLAEQLFAADAPVDAASAAFAALAEELDLHAYFNFLPEDETTLRLDSYSGIPSHAAHLIQHLEVGQAVCGLVAQRREPIHATDIQNSEEQRVDLIRRFGLRAYFCNPLLVGNELFGTLSFGTRSRDAFTEEEMVLLTSVVRYVALANERMRSRSDLRQAKDAAEEASRAKSEFLANMSHEIRTPMTVFMAAIEHLQQMDDDPERRPLLEMADQAANRLRALIDDILDLSRIEARKVDLDEKSFDLRAAVREAVDLFILPAREKNLRLESEVWPETPELVVGDPDRLGQVLVNLIGNAVKFTESGEIRVDVRPLQGMLEFAVADSGIGIPEEKRDLLFENFSQVDSSFTRRYGGSGLGLAICKGLVELMGGDISVRSREGQGSVFTFTLPLRAEPPPRATEAPVPGAGQETSTARILLAEDDPMIRQMLTLMLAKNGYRLDHAETGRAALKKWENGGFDLIFMDLQMPEMSGLEATRAIRQQEAEGATRTCIVGLTAHVGREIKGDCLKAGMDDVLSKPVRMAELQTAIHACLQQ